MKSIVVLFVDKYIVRIIISCAGFYLIFILLKMIAGVYHCEKNKVCFLSSVGVYGLSIALVYYIETSYANIVIQILGVL